MVLKYASQIAALNAEIAKLDADLMSDPQWQALTQKKHSTPVRSAETDTLFAHLRQEHELARNPVYRARVKLLEAVQILQQFSTPDTMHDIDDLGAADALETHRDDNERVTLACSRAGDDSPGSVGGLNDAPQVSVATPDNLTRIRGITRTLNEKLASLGVTRFRQIADWTNKDRQEISAQLGLDREISRQNWIAQAALLADKSAETSTVPEAPKAAPKFGSSTKPGAQPLQMPALSHPVAPSPSDALAPPLAAQHQGTVSDASQVLIKSAAHGVIRRLQAHNDATPTHPDSNQTVAKQAPKAPPVAPRLPATTPVTPTSSSPLPVSRPLHPQSQIVFSPKLVPEPRRVMAEKDRQHLKSEKPRVPTEEPARPTNRSETSQKPPVLARSDSGTVPRPAKQVLPKEKLRFRRLKPKSSPSSTATDEAPLPSVTHQQSIHNDDSQVSFKRTASASSPQDGEAVDTRVKGSSSNPLCPPPVPSQSKKVNAFKNRRWMRQRAQKAVPTGGRSRFGDGEPWRQADPVLTGPVLHEDVALDSKIYVHTDEASVEIVRPHLNTAATRDPVDAPSRRPSEPDTQASETGKTAKSVRRHPAKRIFGVLKRE